MMSTPGGDVHAGLSLYHWLKKLPMNIIIYNFGSVDSIGGVIFCAGTERVSVNHARFLLHPVGFQISGQFIGFDEKSLDEKIKILKSDQDNIAEIIALTTGATSVDVKKKIHERTTLSSIEARDFGLVTKLADDKIPVGAELKVIGSGNMQQPFPPFPFQNPNASASIPIQSFSSPQQSICYPDQSNTILSRKF